jgi:hypothetical protein
VVAPERQELLILQAAEGGEQLRERCEGKGNVLQSGLCIVGQRE